MEFRVQGSEAGSQSAGLRVHDVRHMVRQSSHVDELSLVLVLTMSGSGTSPINPLPRSSQLTHRNVQRFREGLLFEVHRLSYHPTLCVRVIKKKKKFSQPAYGTLVT